MSGQIDKLMQWNCSTIFLLNPLDLDKQRLDKIGFKGTYLNDEYNKTEYENPVFILFKPENVFNFQVFVDAEYDRVNKHTGSKDLRGDYNRGDGEVVLVYEFPFAEDYQRFITGKYSEFSEEIIKTYPKTIKFKKGDNEVTLLGIPYRIITKDKESQELLTEAYGDNFLVHQPILTMAEMLEDRYGTPFTEDMELWTLPNIEKETLKYE